MFDFCAYVDRFSLIRVVTLKRRSDACVMFLFDVLSGRVGSPNLLSLDNVIAPWSHNSGSDFLRTGFHSTLMRLLVC
jgi:hypothetical protein